MARISVGGCVKIPDGRIARIRERKGHKYIVRVRRRTSKTQQLVQMDAKDLKPVPVPKGWMSQKGYSRYMKHTLAKLRARRRKKASTRR